MRRSRRIKRRGLARRGKAKGYKRRVAMQKRKSKKYNSYRVSRGGIRL
jgi:hypothetical protein